MVELLLQVMNYRQEQSDKFAALVKVQPHPLRATQTTDCLFVWNLTRQTCEDWSDCWMTDSVQALSLAFLRSWPRGM